MQEALAIFYIVVIILFIIYGLASLIDDVIFCCKKRNQMENIVTEQFVGASRLVKKPCSRETAEAFVGSDVDTYLRKHYTESLSLSNINAKVESVTDMDYKILAKTLYKDIGDGRVSKYGEIFSAEDALKDFKDSYEKVTVYFEIKRTKE